MPWIVWGDLSEQCFVDFRVFNPLAVFPLSLPHSRSMKIKRHAYCQRICKIEHASFTSVVMSAAEGLAYENTVFYKYLASLMTDMWSDDYSVVLGWLSIGLSLLRSPIQCIRSVCSSIGVCTGFQHQMIK